MADSHSGLTLVHLGDLELENQQGKKSVFTSKAKIGEFLVSGEGAVFGPHLNGMVQWDLSQEAGDDPFGCTLRGEILTDDQARIRFDTLGYMIQGAVADPSKWQLTGSLHFETGSRQYEWLNIVLGVLQGHYDMGSFRHSYRIFYQQIG